MEKEFVPYEQALALKELRIGNLIYKVYPDGEEIIEVEKISKNYINNLNISGIKPIPLNKELFLKFGFNERGVNYTKFLEEGIEFIIWDCNGIFIEDKNGVRIKYVHQLQNLFFCLRGKELTIKIKKKFGY